MTTALGTVISGTMRPEDLIPAFMSTLDDLKQELSLSVDKGKELETVRRIGDLDNRMGQVERRMEQDGYFDSDDAIYDLEWLFDELNSFAPVGAYFGAHPGDGSDYGFWMGEIETDDEDGDGQ